MPETPPSLRGGQVEMNRESIARQKKIEEQEAAKRDKRKKPIPLAGVGRLVGSREKETME